MSRCEACDVPPPKGEVEFCPHCGRNSRDHHVVEMVLNEYPEIAAWVIRRQGGIPAEDIAARSLEWTSHQYPGAGDRVMLCQKDGAFIVIRKEDGVELVVLKKREEAE